jgi:hypothetical protein
MIVKSINHEWLAEVESETIGFNHLSPKALLTHLCNIHGSLDHMDVTELTPTSKRSKPPQLISREEINMSISYRKSDKEKNQNYYLPLPLQRSNRRANSNLLSANGK